MDCESAVYRRALDNFARLTSIAVVAFGLSACQGGLDSLGVGDRGNVPIPKKLIHKMKAKNMAVSSPIMLRIFKQENVLEVWKAKANGRYALLDEYEICKWSGKLGPKFKEGDRQAPEGFYTVNKHQLNPRSQYHLAFNMGFPNAYDRAHGRTGSHLMIHGACSSAGCYSMTDERVEDIYALGREALKGGQKKIQIQAYPFRMTPENMVKHRNSPHYDFWQMLKVGYDHFEVTRVPPKVNICEKRYVFNTESDAPYPTSGQCPDLRMPQSVALAFTKRQNKQAPIFEKLLAKAEDRPAQDVMESRPEEVLPGVQFTLPPKPEPVVEEPPSATGALDDGTSTNDDVPSAGQTATGPAATPTAASVDQSAALPGVTVPVAAQ